MQSHALLEHGYNFEQSKEITKTIANWNINQVQGIRDLQSLCKLCAKTNLLEFHFKQMIDASKEGFQHTCNNNTNNTKTQALSDEENIPTTEQNKESRTTEN